MRAHALRVHELLHCTMQLHFDCTMERTFSGFAYMRLSAEGRCLKRGFTCCSSTCTGGTKWTTLSLPSPSPSPSPPALTPRPFASLDMSGLSRGSSRSRDVDAARARLSAGKGLPPARWTSTSSAAWRQRCLSASCHAFRPDDGMGTEKRARSALPASVPPCGSALSPKISEAGSGSSSERAGTTRNAFTIARKGESTVLSKLSSAGSGSCTTSSAPGDWRCGDASTSVRRWTTSTSTFSSVCDTTLPSQRIAESTLDSRECVGGSALRDGI